MKFYDSLLSHRRRIAGSSVNCVKDPEISSTYMERELRAEDKEENFIGVLCWTPAPRDGMNQNLTIDYFQYSNSV